MTSAVSAVDGGVRLRVRVQPRASRSSIDGLRGDAIRIRLQAPPVDGAANEALIALLSEVLDVARSRIAIEQGLSSRCKTVRIEGVSAQAVIQRLQIGQV